MMYRLSKNDYGKVTPIFEDVRNSRPVIFSVIDGNLDGQIYVDDLENPITALIVLYDMFFCWGHPDSQTCREIYELITNDIFPTMSEEYMDFYCMANCDEMEQLFLARIKGKPVRKTFEFNKEAFEPHLNWRMNIPDGYTMELINEDFVIKHDYDREFWSSHTKRFGFSLTYHNEIVSECTAVFVGAGMVEISIDTRDIYRNKGFATITCAAFIEHCISIGLEPNWGCWDFRTASIALANRLGFKEKSDFVVFSLKK